METDPLDNKLKGYKGQAHRKLTEWGVSVWGDVRIVNDAGSVFEGVILPRSETADDLHTQFRRAKRAVVDVRLKESLAGLKKIRQGVEE